MPNLILKLNISAIHNSKYLLQLQFQRYTNSFIKVFDFDGTGNSHTLWGKDYDIYLPDEIDTINFDYDFNDKLILPGIWNLSIFDNNSFLDEMIFENDPSHFEISEHFYPDLTKPISAILYKINDDEIFQFPLEVFHQPFYSGHVLSKPIEFKDKDKLLSITIAPNVADLKKADIHNLKAIRSDALEIPDDNLSFRDNLYYLLQVAFPELTKDNIFIDHDFVFCAHNDPTLSHDSSNPNTIFAAGSVGEYSIHDLYFNVRDISTRLGINSCHDILKALCFSYFATLTVTHNKIVFASVNKSFKTDTTINVSRSLSDFSKEISFERLEWINVHEVSANSRLGYLIGTQSTLTNGFDKDIVLVTIMNFIVRDGETKYVLTSPLKVKNSSGTFLHVIFAKQNSLATDYRTFRRLLAEVWYNYMNKFTSGRIYKFAIEGTEFNYSNSIGHVNNGNPRLYSPVSIHYNIVEDCTDVEAVRN